MKDNDDNKKNMQVPFNLKDAMKLAFNNDDDDNASDNSNSQKIENNENATPAKQEPFYSFDEETQELLSKRAKKKSRTYENENIAPPKAILVCCVTENYDLASFEELAELVETAGAVVDCSVCQNRKTPDVATCIGAGKLEEIKSYAMSHKIELVVFDNTLSPTQLRNIENILNDKPKLSENQLASSPSARKKLEEFHQIKVLDRPNIILDIFAMRAKSAEGKVQVELAQLNYMLPRLRRASSSLSKLAGGIGTRGPGESQLESDRRHIMRRIENLKQSLEQIRKNRELQRKRRLKSDIPLVAIAGYTNAGKSTLMNYLTEADVFAENMLFATLDSTTRSLKLPGGDTVLFADTVGFIRNLPHELIYAFKSTLEDIVMADLVLLVADITSPNCKSQIETVEQTLSQIGFNGNIIKVFNKFDKITETTADIKFFPTKNSVYISAKTGKGVDVMLEKIEEVLKTYKTYSLAIPYDKISIYYSLKENGKIVENSDEFMEGQIRFKANLNEPEYEKYSNYIIID